MAEVNPRRIRLLVVDDSVISRKIVSNAIKSADDLELIAAVADGRHALEIVASGKCDLVTLDIQTLGMDGLELLTEILKIHPIPVIMISVQSQRRSEITLEALDRGAVDYLSKPDSTDEDHSSFLSELLRKIRTLAGVNTEHILEFRRRREKRLAQLRDQRATTDSAKEGSEKRPTSCIAIGISTGGPPVLERLVSELRPPQPPIVIVQHMLASFTRPFAERLNDLSALSIKEVEEGDPLLSNRAYLAPGWAHIALRKVGYDVLFTLRDGPPVSGHRPSADVMMQSVADCFPKRCLGVIMTGMGHDGVDGCAAIRRAGGYVLGQDEATSDVYGMNKQAFIQGHVDRQFGLDLATATIAQTARERFGVESSCVL